MEAALTATLPAMQAPRRPVPRIGLSRAEVALAIGVSGNTVDLMVSEGVLPAPRRWHTRKIWLVAEIEAALAAWPTQDEARERPLETSDEWRAE